MKQSFIALLCGTLFGFGLAFSGMIHPENVIAFLDITGQWDPGLALVMAGALVVAIPGFYFIRQRHQPLMASDFCLSAKTNIDAPLVAGAALFGIGWGMSGYCPGPAIAGLGIGNLDAIFVILSIYTGFMSQPLFFKKINSGR